MTALRRSSSRLLVALIGLSVTAILVGGCACNEPAWGDRTRALNRTYYVDGQLDDQIIYRDSQTPGARLTLLFVHGVGSSKGTWQFVAPAFEHDYRVILLDLLGHGDSSKPAQHDYSMAAQGEIVRKFIVDEDLHDLVVVGCSYGGGVTLESVLPLFQAHDAQRIRGLVLIGAAATEFPPPPNYALVQNPVLRMLALLVFTPDSLAHFLLKDVFWQEKAIPPDLLHEYARVYREPGAINAGILAGLDIFPELHARAGETDRYAAIACPVLLLWGDHDRIVPHSVMERLEEMLPDVRARIIADCGHTPQEEQPERTIEAIRAFMMESMRAEEERRPASLPAAGESGHLPHCASAGVSSGGSL